MISSDCVQRVPTVLVDFEAGSLDTSNSVDEYLLADSSLPGLVQANDDRASVTRSLWSSTRNSDFDGVWPREVGVRVLAASHYLVQAIRIVFKPTKRPSQLQVLVASLADDDKSRLHTASDFFSADFQMANEPTVWPHESALSWPPAPTEVTIQLQQESMPVHGYNLIKLVMYRPHVHPHNPHNEVDIKDIEVLGVFQVPSRHIVDEAMVNTDEGTDLPELATEVSIRRSLEAAGLPDHLITELMEMKESVPLSSTEPLRPFQEPELPSRDVPVTLPQESVLDSVFDLSMREYIQSRRDQEILLATIMSPRDNGRLETHKHCTKGFTAPTHHPSRQEAVVIYTFGSFFTQCLLASDDAELIIHSLRIAERLSPLLLPAGLPFELLYEGLLAVVALALHNPSREVFHAALHLVRTIFQHRSREYSLPTTLSRGHMNTGVARVLGAVLASSHCWATIGGNRESTSSRTMDRELLKTVRLLYEGDRTRSGLLVYLHSHHRDGNQTTQPDDSDLSQHNRLRLTRWLLQRHRADLSSDDLSRIRSYCNSQASSSDATKRLTCKCLELLDSPPPQKSSLSSQLELVKKLANASHGARPDHVPLFDSFPLSQPQRTECIRVMQQYYKLHTRPFALYSHSFTADSLEEHRGEFRKGNIVFKGEVEARPVPNHSFTDDIRGQTQPFTFDKPANTAGGDVLNLETSFAKFRGTVEARRDEPVRAQSPRRPSVPKMSAELKQAIPVGTLTKRPSISKPNQVVPVDTPLSGGTPIATTVPPTTTPDPSVPSPPSLERRVSTAAPVLVNSPAVAAESPTKDVAAVSQAQAQETTQPKTAPPGKNRSSTSASQDGGCSIQ